MVDYKRMLIRTYDATVKEYAQHEFDNPIMEKHYKKFLSLLPQNARILDAGCGPGQAAKRFADAGHAVLGIDLSKKMIAFAKKAVPKARFLVQDITKIRLRKQFDSVWAAFILVHVPRSKHLAVLKRFNRLLPLGGILFLGLLEGKGERITAEPYNRKYKQYFVFSTQNEVKKNLKTAGFELISYTTETAEEDGEPFTFSFAYAKKSK